MSSKNSPRTGEPAAQLEVGGPGPDAEGNVPDPLGERQVKKSASRVSIAKTKIVVRQAFNLTDDHGATVRYEVGEQEMPTAHADHWYAKNHID